MVGIGALIAASAIQTNQANEVLSRSLEILGKADTVVGSFTQTIGRGIGKGDFHLKKDKKLAVYSDSVTELCDGAYRTTIDRKTGTYTVKDIRVFDLVYMPGFEAFTKNQKNAREKETLVEKFANDAKNAKRDPEPKEVRMAVVDGKRVVSYLLGGSRVYLDPQTALPLGADFFGENQQTVRMRFSNVRLNVPLDDNMFSLDRNQTLKEEQVVDSGMLQVGDQVPTANGIPAMELFDKFTKGKKHSVVIFFDDSNASVSDMLLKFQNMKRIPKDVGIVGVTRLGEKGWRPLFPGRPKFALIEDAGLPSQSIVSRFGITRYPTVYIMDENRRIEYVQIGSDTSDLDSFLKGIGIAKP